MEKSQHSSRNFRKWQRLKAVAFFILLPLTIGVALGPRVPTGIQLAESPLTSIQIHELDEWLDREEISAGARSPSTRRTIQWAGEPGIKTELSLIYLHGFTATWQETAPLTSNIGRNLAANVYQHRFSGHGLDSDAMKNVTLNDWVQSARQAIHIGRIIGDKTFIIGCSNGAALGLIAADLDGEGILGMALISPHFRPIDPRAGIVLWPWGLQIARAMVGDEQTWEFKSPEHSQYWTSPYPTSSLGAVMATARTVSSLKFDQFNIPVLWIANPVDTIVDYESAGRAFGRMASPMNEHLLVTEDTDHNHHVLAGDLRSPETTGTLSDAITSFIHKISANEESR